VVAETEMCNQSVVVKRISSERRLSLRYAGSDTSLVVDFDTRRQMTKSFERLHSKRFGFMSPEKQIVVEAVQIEVTGAMERPNMDAGERGADRSTIVLANHPVEMDGKQVETPFYMREELGRGDRIKGPAVIVEAHGTIVVEPGWQAELTLRDDIVLERYQPLPQRVAIGTDVDPVMLEIFNNLFMSIAEQMGTVLENTASSVNIKERLDFSCAVFDQEGDLIANAPHMPVHLGSMGESIKAVLRKHGGDMHRGDAFILNAPYDGGTISLT